MGIRRYTEAPVLRGCLELLAYCGVLAWRNNTAAVLRRDKKGRQFYAFHGRKGASDILGCLPPRGQFFACEVKAPGKRPSEEQTAFLRDVEAVGGVGCWVDSVHELSAILRDLGIWPGRYPEIKHDPPSNARSHKAKGRHQHCQPGVPELEGHEAAMLLQEEREVPTVRGSRRARRRPMARP